MDGRRQPGRRQHHRLRNRCQDRRPDAHRSEGRGRRSSVCEVCSEIVTPKESSPMQSEYLFNRRTFLQTAAATTAGLALGTSATAAIKFGEGKAAYTLDEKWGILPTGMNYGFGCALVVDGKDRIYVTSRSPNACVVIFDSAGKILETWAQDIKDRVGYDPNQYTATAHGLYWSKEGDKEFLYWTENVATPKGQPKLGARV